MKRLWLHRLRQLARLAGQTRSRVRRLVSRTREPLVIFAEFRHSLIAIRRHLLWSRHLVARTVVELLPNEETRSINFSAVRRRSCCDGYAAQGLNLQHRGAVGGELSPVKSCAVGQRIGRVDRIGRTDPTRNAAHRAARPRRASFAPAARATPRQQAFGGDILRCRAAAGLSMARALISGSDDGHGYPPALRFVVRDRRRSSRRRESRRLPAEHWRANGVSPRQAVMWTVSRGPRLNSSSFVVLSIPLIDARADSETVFCGAASPRFADRSGSSRAFDRAGAKIVSRLVRARMRRVPVSGGSRSSGGQGSKPYRLLARTAAGELQPAPSPGSRYIRSTKANWKILLDGQQPPSRICEIRGSKLVSKIGRSCVPVDDSLPASQDAFPGRYVCDRHRRRRDGDRPNERTPTLSGVVVARCPRL
jgi:hypothetical protein